MAVFVAGILVCYLWIYYLSSQLSKGSDGANGEFSTFQLRLFVFYKFYFVKIISKY